MIIPEMQKPCNTGKKLVKWSYSTKGDIAMKKPVYYVILALLIGVFLFAAYKVGSYYPGEIPQR